MRTEPTPHPAALTVLSPLQKKSPPKVDFVAQSPVKSPLSIDLIPRTPHIVAITRSESVKPKTAQQVQVPDAMLLRPPTPPARHGFGLLTVVFLVVVIPISLARLRR
jgi:hypothetical protein